MKNKNIKNVVLIADDDLFIRKIITSALQNYATIVEAPDGAEVLKLYREHTPDIVFLDIHLPNQSGLDLVSALKAEDKTAFIIMLSADSSAQNVKTAQSNGAQGFLTKPFDKKRIMHYFHACPTISFMDF